MDSLARTWRLGLASLVALALVWGLRALVDVPCATPLLGIAALLVMGLAITASRGRVPAAHAAWIGMASVASIATGAWWALEEDVPCIDAGVGVVASLFAGTFAFVAAVLLNVLLAPSLAGIPVRSRHSLARAFAIVAIVTSALAGVAGVASRVHRDDPAAMNARVRSLQPGDPDDPRWREDEDRGRGSPRAVFYQGPAGKECRILVRDSHGRRDEILAEPSRPCALKRLQYIEERRLWFVQPTPYKQVVEKAFEGPPFHERKSTFASFASELAPPRAWSLGALFGALLALVHLLPRDRALTERLAWREERIGDRAFLVSPRAPEETYRSALDVHDASLVHAGTRDELLDAIARVRAGRWALAAMTACLFGAPVWVAAARGFLG
jgi:hypothetical protein